MAYDNFSNILSSIKRQSAAVSGRPSSRGTVSGVLSGVAAGADSRVANKRQLEMQGRQADIQQQGQDLNVQRFAEEKRQSDIELQMAHEAAMRNTKAQRSQSVSQGLATAGSLAAMKYLAGAKVGATVPSVTISTVGSGGGAAGGGASAGGTSAATSGSSAGGSGGLSMATAAPVAFAAYAALMTGMALSARSQGHARRAQNQAIDSAGGMTNDPNQNYQYAYRRAQERYQQEHGESHSDFYGKLENIYPDMFNSNDNYRIDVAPLDNGKNQMLYGTDYAPASEEARQEAIRRTALARAKANEWMG